MSPDYHQRFVMDEIVFALPGSDHFAEQVARRLDAPCGELAARRFPDGESWVQVRSECRGRAAVLVASLDQPDTKLSQLLFVAETLRELGARQVGLAAPYLPYMRQDQRFEPGEGVTARYFARLLSSYFSWLVTLDPHLHRLGSLDELYAMPTFTAHAAEPIARWLTGFDFQPFLVGPDAESEQWVGAVSRLADCPYVVFDKTRRGDRDVELGHVDLEPYAGRQPVVLDDIISTGATMVETIGRLSQAGFSRPVCVGIHGVFADDAVAHLAEAGAGRVLTCNTIAHPSNVIDVADALGEAVARALRPSSGDRPGAV